MATTQSGLSRRRGGPSHGGAQTSHNGTAPLAPGVSSPPGASLNGNSPSQRFGGVSAAATGAGGASSRPTTPAGHRVAFDERDLESSEDQIMPKLTLMEEVLLLGLKDKQTIGIVTTLLLEVVLAEKAWGYLSFWNDNISYTLRGCIVLELALRHRIAMVRDPNRRRFPLADRYIEVVDDRLTGEVLLDEALKMMKISERMSVGTWIDLMSGERLPFCRHISSIPAPTIAGHTLVVGALVALCTWPLTKDERILFIGETWNVMKIGYQLKQVRERLAKGLVDKGVLRTEKRNFLLFDMATHPVSDPTFKDDVLRRTLGLLTARTAAVPTSDLYGERVRYRTIRAVSMVCAAFSANVLENALVHLSYDAREAAFAKCDELLAEFSQWPFAAFRPPSAGGGGIGAGSASANVENANLAEINRLARGEMSGGEGGAEGQTQRELHLEVVAAVLEVCRRMDSLL